MLFVEQRYESLSMSKALGNKIRFTLDCIRGEMGLLPVDLITDRRGRGDAGEGWSECAGKNGDSSVSISWAGNTD